MKNLFLVLVLLTSGCAARVTHPGAMSQFDSVTYDSLLVTHSVIESTKADLLGGAFSETLAPKIKTALNNLIQAYDAADYLYVEYHTQLVAGTATATQQGLVASKIQAVDIATTALSTAKAGQ